MNIKLTLLFAVSGVALFLYLFGRSLWYPVYMKVSGPRSVSEVMALFGPRARAELQLRFNAAGVAYPAQQLTFLALKDTGQLEVWAGPNSSPVFIHSYPIKAHSGDAGPKLREGDHQVPEGIYKITGLNPNSSFHLSMKLNYPNEFDLKYAKLEGRDEPGTNIFIHGKASSVGCLAMGDPAIEELFVLVNDSGRQNVTVVIAPGDPRRKSLERLPQISWSDTLYTDIEQVFSNFVRDPG